MKQSKKALSLIVMILIVVKTLAPTWAFGT